MIPRLDLTALAGLIALAAIWGGSFFFAEIALQELHPMQVTLHRLIWAVPLLYVAVKLKGLSVPMDLKNGLGFLGMGALNNAIPFTLIFWGQTHLQSGTASVLNATTGVFGAAVAGALLRDEPLSRRRVSGALVGLLGVAVVMGRDTLQSFDLLNLAQWAILGAALSYSFASVWARARLAHNPPLVNAFGMVTASAGIILGAVWFAHGHVPLRLSLPTWGAIGGLSVACTAVAYLLYFAVLKRAGAANLMLVTLLIPPFAITLGVVFLNESPSASLFAGMAVICLGLLISDGRLAARLFKR